jgi:hypothetical protein
LWKEKATEDTPTPPKRLRRLEEFTEMKKYNTPSEFSPSGAAGPHSPDLGGVLSFDCAQDGVCGKKNWRRSNK